MKFIHIFFCFSLILLVACFEKNENVQGQHSNSINKSPVFDSGAQPLGHASVNIEVKTFEVKDSSGNSQGWGYDILIDGKRAIHQPIIPAVSGNRSFETEADAKKTGLFAVEKMNNSGSLPTLSLQELDSLGVVIDW